MKLVVLDGYTTNPGDLSWQGLEALAACEIYDRTPAERVRERAAGAELLLTNKTELPAHVLDGLPELAYIGVLATGFDVVDAEAARRHGVPVTNVPAYGTLSVAQMVFAHLLNLAQHVAHHAGTVREGRWCESDDFCYWDTPLVELAGLTMGIVGFGRIGRAVAQRAAAFEMRVLVHDPCLPDRLPHGAEPAGLERLFRESDVVSLHCPLTDKTRGLVNADLLRRMKTTAVLINTARGPLVDEQALADALQRGALAGAGLDVLSSEPPDRNHPLLSAEHCHITPHIAWATRAARQRLLDTAVENVRAFLKGKPQNVVNAA